MTVGKKTDCLHFPAVQSTNTEKKILLIFYVPEEVVPDNVFGPDRVTFKQENKYYVRLVCGSYF